MRLPRHVLLAGRPADRQRCIASRQLQLVSTTWTDLLDELEGLIVEVVAHGSAFVALHVPGPDDLFVQLGVLDNGQVTAEAVSTTNRPCPRPACPQPRHLLTRAEQAELRALGWRAPNQARVNFHRTSEPGWRWVAPLFSELFVRTLAEPFGTPSPVGITLTAGHLVPGYRPDQVHTDAASVASEADDADRQHAVPRE